MLDCFSRDVCVCLLVCFVRRDGKDRILLSGCCQCKLTLRTGLLLLHSLAVQRVSLAVTTLYLQQRLCATGLAAAALSFSCSGCVQLGVLHSLQRLYNGPCSHSATRLAALPHSFPWLCNVRCWPTLCSHPVAAAADLAHSLSLCLSRSLSAAVHYILLSRATDIAALSLHGLCNWHSSREFCESASNPHCTYRYDDDGDG